MQIALDEGEVTEETLIRDCHRRKYAPWNENTYKRTSKNHRKYSRIDWNAVAFLMSF